MTKFISRVILKLTICLVFFGVSSPTILAVPTNTSVYPTSLKQAFTPSDTAKSIPVELNKVQYIGPNTAYIVGDEGTVLKSTDAGETWSAVLKNRPHDFNDLFFLSADYGYIVGDAGRILKTTNGGVSWTSQNSGTIETLRSVFFLGKKNGYVGGSGGILLHTTDGGTTWNTQNCGTTERIYDLNFSFTDLNIGIAATEGGNILRTTDGGSTWSLQKNVNGAGESFKRVRFKDDSNGWIVGSGGYIYRTTNGGISWTQQESPTETDFNDLIFVNDQQFWAVGDDGTVAKTEDAGLTWTLADREYPDLELNGAAFYDNSKIIVGNEGVIIQSSSNNREISNTVSFYHKPIKPVNDGPYIFKNGRNFTAKWIKNDTLHKQPVQNNNIKVQTTKQEFEVSIDWPDDEANKPSRTYKNVDKLAAISDIHGQYSLFVKLLKANGIIDENMNWNFDGGHLVITGDIFDRGPKVTETLWLVYRLEQQAEKSGGKVHYLLGNHEVMVLGNDLRYLNKKYEHVSELIGKPYGQLFSENTILGQWLRTKSVIAKINDIIFLHGGISPAFIDRKLTLGTANKAFRSGILGKDNAAIRKDGLLNFLTGSQGPIWYRGYFRDEEFDEVQLDAILSYFDVRHIVVGHTSHSSITPLFNGKIYGIDTSIKKGVSGEILLYKNGKFSKGTLTGDVKRIQQYQPG